MLALPFAGMPAHKHQPGWCREPLLPAGERADQEIESLDCREASDVEQHGARREPRHVLVAIARAAGQLAGQPALRLLHQDAPPEGVPVERASPKQLDVDAVGELDDTLARHAEQRQGALDAGWRDDDARTALRPSAQPLRPARSVPPIVRGAGGDLLKHQQLGAMQLTDDRYVRRDARWAE